MTGKVDAAPFCRSTSCLDQSLRFVIPYVYARVAASLLLPAPISRAFLSVFPCAVNHCLTISYPKEKSREPRHKKFMAVSSCTHKDLYHYYITGR
jgi:hypothetical protein